MAGSALALTYALASPLTGALLDRLGLNRGASLAVGAWSVCCAATSLVTGFAGLVAARLGLGMAESAGIPSVGKMSATYLLPRERGVGAAINQVGLTLGGIPGARRGLLAAVDGYGWRAPFLPAGILGLLLIPLWLFVARAIPASPAATVEQNERRDMTAWRDPHMLMLGGVGTSSA